MQVPTLFNKKKMYAYDNFFQKLFHNAYNGMPSKPETLTSVFLMLLLYAY